MHDNHKEEALTLLARHRSDALESLRGLMSHLADVDKLETEVTVEVDVPDGEDGTETVDIDTTVHVSLDDIAGKGTQAQIQHVLNVLEDAGVFAR